MHKLFAILIAGAAFGVATVHAQTTAPAPAKPAAAPAKPAATPTVKALQPGLFEVAGPKVNEAVAAGITKIVVTPGKGWRSIHVQSPWSDTYHGYPANLKPVAFTITTGKGGTAQISAPGFTEANKADYRAAIEAVVPFAISATEGNKNWMLHSKSR